MNHPAFITNFANHTISSCKVDIANGALSACIATTAGAPGTTFNFPLGITLNLAGDIAFITNFSGNTISSCRVDIANGALSACIATTAGAPGTTFNGPRAIALNLAGDIAYIASNDNTISSCKVNIANGALSACVATIAAAPGTTFNGPFGITLL